MFFLCVELDKEKKKRKLVREENQRLGIDTGPLYDHEVVHGDEDRYLVAPLTFAITTYICVALFLLFCWLDYRSDCSNEWKFFMKQCLFFSAKLFKPSGLFALVVGVGISSYAFAKSVAPRTVYFF